MCLQRNTQISGLLILDKPVGLTSAQAVSKVKRLFQASKAGHGGTLDPLTSGILPIAIGSATKVLGYIQNGFKSYRFSISWGEERSTDDCEGDVVQRSNIYPTYEAIEKAILRYKGSILQVPPLFSAIKISGKRAYERARSGEIFSIQAREVEISRFDFLEYQEDHATFEIACSKGTYVRSLARDIGRDLGCFGYISRLRRLSVGLFEEHDAIAMNLIELFFESGDQCKQSAADKFLLKPERVLSSMIKLCISKEQAFQVIHGASIYIENIEKVDIEQKAYVMFEDSLLAIGVIRSDYFFPQSVFNSFF